MANPDDCDAQSLVWGFTLLKPVCNPLESIKLVNHHSFREVCEHLNASELECVFE